MQTLNQNTGMEAIQFMPNKNSVPPSVISAVRIIWISLAVSLACVLYAKLSNEITTAHFLGSLLFYAFTCLIPFKLLRGCNAARFIYLLLVLCVASFAAYGSVGDVANSVVTGILLVLPLAAWASVLLLKKETTVWLNSLLRKPGFFNLKQNPHQYKWNLYKKTVLD